MYVILWKFVVKPESMSAFVGAYGPDGDWAKLFRRAEGYLGTELLAAEDGECFVTLDRWEAPECCVRFQEVFGREYKALDAQLSGLTTSETRLGAFSVPG